MPAVPAPEPYGPYPRLRRQLDKSYTEGQLRRMFRKADTNGDQLLDLNEFLLLQWRHAVRNDEDGTSHRSSHRSEDGGVGGGAARPGGDPEGDTGSAYDHYDDEPYEYNAYEYEYESVELEDPETWSEDVSGDSYTGSR